MFFLYVLVSFHEAQKWPQRSEMVGPPPFDMKPNSDCRIPGKKGHASLIQYRCSSQGPPHWSKSVYVNMKAHGVTGQRRSGSMRSPWSGFECYSTKDTGTPMADEPRAHSEIASLQELFGIPGNANLDQWVNHIVGLYGTPQHPFPGFCERGNNVRLHVQIMNSRLAPCVGDEKKELPPYAADREVLRGEPVPKREGDQSRASRQMGGMPCHDFLKELVRRVRQATNNRFVIHVAYPATKIEDGQVVPTGEVMVVRYGEATTVQKYPTANHAMSNRAGEQFRAPNAARDEMFHNWNGTYCYWG